MDNELIVQFAKGTNAIEVCRELSLDSEIEFMAIKSLSQRMNIWLISFEKGLGDSRTRQYVEGHRKVVLAQFNHVNLSSRTLPNDSLFNKQWALENNGTNGGAGLNDIDALDAWDIATGGISPNGDTIVVAVIDQGFDVNHIDLVENYFINRGEIPGNEIDDDGNGYIDDVMGWNCYTNSPIHPNNNHGTHVAGTVGARGNNEIGVAGVNWKVKILPITGSSTLESIVVEAYAYVLEMRMLYNETNGEKGAYIVSTNASFGVDNGQPIDYPIWCSMYDSLGYQGVLSAGATANNNVDIDQVGDIPTACNSPFLISVTNTTSSDQINSSAAYGLETIDLGAPGTQIYSTVPGDNYGNNTGTSMATPHVAGTIGLMYNALCPDVFNSFKYDQAGLALFIKNKLLNQGVDQISSLNGKVVSGGRLNLYKSVLSVSSLCTQIVFNAVESECDSCNGIIEASLTGSSGPFQYYWSNGAVSDSIFDLCPGVYQLTVVDGNGDSISSAYALSDIGGPSLSIDIQDPKCADSYDGYISVLGGFNYGWFDGSTEANRSGLSSGDYFLTATDTAGVCTTAIQVVLVAPDSLNLIFEYTLPSSTSTADGSILALGFGGAPPYSFNWETGDTTTLLSNLTNGSYSITITDKNNCSRELKAQLGYPTGQIEMNRDDVHIWPNPANSGFEMYSSSSLTNIYIVDMKGRRVYNENIMGLNHVFISTIDISTGIYIVELRSGEKVEHFKLIISHEP